MLGRHRKLMPTYTERVYWGQGDGSDITTYDTDIGRIGGLVCWENHMVLVRAAMVYSGQDFHVAVWPGNWRRGEEKLLAAETEDPGAGCTVQPLIRVHAFESGAFVLSACGYLDDDDFPERWHYVRDGNHMNYDWARGGSSLLTQPADIFFLPIRKRRHTLRRLLRKPDKAVKAVFDSLGHYSRWDVAKLLIDREKREPLAEKTAGLRISSREIKRISDDYGVSEEKLEAIAEELKKLFN